MRISQRVFLDIIRAAAAHPRGVGGVLEDAEIARGYKIVPLGARQPFHFDPGDWKRGVISYRDNPHEDGHMAHPRVGEVRIIAIEARKPRHGAFTRLVDRISYAGYDVVVVAAMLDMPTILTKWGWVKKLVKYEGEDEGWVDEWRPR